MTKTNILFSGMNSLIKKCSLNAMEKNQFYSLSNYLLYQKNVFYKFDKIQCKQNVKQAVNLIEKAQKLKFNHNGLQIGVLISLPSREDNFYVVQFITFIYASWNVPECDRFVGILHEIVLLIYAAGLTDIDSFLSPALLLFKLDNKTPIITGHGGYCTKYTTHRLHAVAKRLQLNHQKVHCPGSTWFGKSDVIIKLANLSAHLAMIIYDNEFDAKKYPELRPFFKNSAFGQWPEWWKPVSSIEICSTSNHVERAAFSIICTSTHGMMIADTLPTLRRRKTRRAREEEERQGVSEDVDASEAKQQSPHYVAWHLSPRASCPFLRSGGILPVIRKNLAETLGLTGLIYRRLLCLEDARTVVSIAGPW
ncbi:Acetyl-coenzyme A carboxylase carboxyl transferase subunit alpha [Trichinella spiralis]|uniref:Acetyl-coenzyme A carboxylase carboxyl transferase subunit alpha n=1 Tax=Trichinella spiralis TaxID=6334 RepID=A0ABR3KMV0_TRISP